MIKTLHKPLSSGGIYFIISTEPSDDYQEYSEAIKLCFDSIDPYRSPSIMHMVNNEGHAVAKIKYYNL